MAASGLPAFAELFETSWKRYQREFQTLVTIALIANAGTIIFALARTSVMLTGLLGLASLVLSIWGIFALYAYVMLPNVKTVGQAYRSVQSFFLDGIVTGLVYGLLVVAGLILLIGPGIYWGVLYGFAVYVVIKERLPLGQALSRSKALVTGRWWNIFWKVAVILIFTAAVQSLPGIGFPATSQLGNLIDAVMSALVTPLTVIFIANLYQALAADRPAK